MRDELLAVYKSLFDRFGHRDWWPAESPFEVMIGAILTQNVSWNNVTKAINNLKSAGILDPQALYKANAEDIAPLIIPSRYYNQKAKKIKGYISFFIEEYDGGLSNIKKENVSVLRNKLLKIKGLGQESVDSIMLYACEMPVFVVDAYTIRIMSRYGIIEPDAKYEDVQSLFMDSLPQDVGLYNDFHAQFVQLGNSICRPKPDCDVCPLKEHNGKYRCKKKV